MRGSAFIPDRVSSSSKKMSCRPHSISASRARPRLEELKHAHALPADLQDGDVAALPARCAVPEMARLDTLMRKVLEDAETAVSVLAGLAAVDVARIGILGHSYGGNTALFQAALDERVRFSCSSGAACSFRDKMERGTGIEMAEVLPGVLLQFDIDVLLSLTAPRPALIVSAVDDMYSHDADAIVQLARSSYSDAGCPDGLQHERFQGGHSLDRERFDCIVRWMQLRSARESAE